MGRRVARWHGLGIFGKQSGDKLLPICQFE